MDDEDDDMEDCDAGFDIEEGMTSNEGGSV